MQNNSSCICLNVGLKTVEDADVCEGSLLVHLAEIQNALQHTNLTKFSKISINSYKNKPGGGGVGSYILSATVSPPVMLSAGKQRLIGQSCLFVCFSI